MLYHTDFDPDDIVAYQKHYRRVDLWTIRAAQAVAAGTAQKCGQRSGSADTLFPIGSSCAANSTRISDGASGCASFLRTVLPLGAGGAMPIGLHRPEGDGTFDETDRHLLECLLPHLRRAPAAAAPARGGAFQRVAQPFRTGRHVRFGVLIVGAGHAVARCEHLRRGDGGQQLRIAIGSSDRCSDATSRTVVVAGNHLITPGSKPSFEQQRWCGSSWRRRFGLPNHHEAAALAALVALRCLDASADLLGRFPGPGRWAGARSSTRPHDALPSLHSARPSCAAIHSVLTQAEAEIACALSGGTTKEAVAAKRGLSRNDDTHTGACRAGETGTANLAGSGAPSGSPSRHGMTGNVVGVDTAAHSRVRFWKAYCDVLFCR